MRTSETIAAISAALATAQGAMETVAKDKTADAQKYTYRYASLDTVIAAVRKPLSANEIAFWQAAETDGNGNAVIVTRLMHSSGEWLESQIAVRPAHFDAQGVGSALTYARRYGLLAACGIHPADEDDDGAAAIAAPPPATAPRRADNAPQPPMPQPAPQSDVVVLVDRHGNEAEYSISGEPGSIHAAIETDMVDAAGDGLSALAEAWKRHFAIVKRLPEENRRNLEALKDRLKAKHEGKGTQA